jgi:hypothetical protein
MNLHENKNLFRQAISATAQKMNLPEIYIEKDYWVCVALKAIFSAPIGHHTIFKGGTALSKCFGLIDRFSEDIDLVIQKNESDSGNQLKQRIKQVGTAVSKVLPEVEIQGVSHRRGMIRKTAHSYAHEFSGSYGQVRDVIIVEATWLGGSDPFTTKTVHSNIYEMMLANDQETMTEQFNLCPITVKALRPERTLCEKIMSLIRFSHSNTPVEDLKKKIRHVYDLHQLLNHSKLNAFFHSPDFDRLFLSVSQDDVESFANNNDWLKAHPQEALIFSDLDLIWPQLTPVYEGDFSKLVYGHLPCEAEIYSTLLSIKNRLSTIEWAIQ